MADADGPEIARRLLAIVQARMADEPVVLLQGPRTVGKSRLLAAVAATRDGELIDLDDLGQRGAATADPAFFVSAPGPVVILANSSET